MMIEPLFAPLTPEEFVAAHYRRLPYSGQATAANFCALGSWQILGEMLGPGKLGPGEGGAGGPGGVDIQPLDLLIVRESRQYAGPIPTTRQEAEQLCDDGFTIVVRHAERQHAQLASLAAAFERAFAEPANIHLYVTPPGTHGFGWHYDAEEVFLIQTAGRKEYSLRKNTVNPWPIEETLPADMGFARELMPLVRCELAAGDLLYVPSGYWHMGEGRAQDGEGSGPPSERAAISLAVGLRPTTAVDLFDALRPHVLESLLWRTRLPVRGTVASASEAERLAELRQLIPLLCEDLVRTLAGDELLRKFTADSADVD